jgi:hypothetical protein
MAETNAATSRRRRPELDGKINWKEVDERSLLNGKRESATVPRSPRRLADQNLILPL